MPNEVLIWVDGVASHALPLPDRGLDYGDGLFETILLVNSKPIYLHLHLSRLKLGLSTLNIPDCMAEVIRQIEGVLSTIVSTAEFVMRVTVTRGAGPRGYASPVAPVPRIILCVHKLPESDYKQIQNPASLSLAKVCWSFQPALAGVKHLNRLDQVLAATEKRQLGVDEVLMLDHQSNIISVSAGNIFALIGGQLVTPSLSGCGVAGTRRRLVLEALAPALGLPACEATITIDELKGAAEVFYCNALTGFRPVAKFAGRSWQSFDVCTALHRLYCERIC